MGMNFVAMFLMYVLAGGASDLLDAVPTDSYWEAKGVHATAQTLAAELAPPAAAGDLSKLIDDLASDDPATREAAATKIRAAGKGAITQLEEAAKGDNPQVAGRSRRLISDLKNGDKVGQVRRLMAIRAAGEKKVEALLPRLKELAKSEDFFTADYAAAAVAAIEHNPYARPHPACGDDAWLMPEGVRGVLHLSASGGQAVTADALKALLSAQGGGVGNDPNDPAAEDKQKAAEHAMGQLIDVAEKMGNMRVDGVTVGVSGNMGGNGGYAVAVFHGRYDAKAAVTLIRAMGGERIKARTVGGVDVLDIGNDGALLLPDDTRVALVGGPNQNKDAPIDAIADALKTGKQPLKGMPEMAKLIGQVDPAAPLWGVMLVTDSFRQAPLFDPLEWVTLTSKAKGEGLEFRFDAKGRDPGRTGSAVGQVNGGLAEARKGIRELAQMMQNQPQRGIAPEHMKALMGAATKMLDSARCVVDEKDPTHASLTGELEIPPASLLGLMFGAFMM